MKAKSFHMKRRSTACGGVPMAIGVQTDMATPALARFKCPRLIEFVDALPRNATGKIHKPTLRQNFNAPKATDKLAS